MDIKTDTVQPNIVKKTVTLKKNRDERLLDALKEIFKLDHFRPKQEIIIQNILDGRDVLALLPTGSGKSLCYQLPSVITTGITIVISPLLALINDQVDYLNGVGIKCYYYNSQSNSEEKKELFSDLSSDYPSCKLLYTTPETLVSNLGLRTHLESLYQKKLLSRIVIDEAHCVSNWGHEFRPSYLQLKQLKKIFPQIQVVAFTATATPKVQIDIIRQLNMKSVLLHKQSFIRHNLSYQVRPKTTHTVVLEMANLIKNKYKKQSGIIYCLSRQDCEDVSEQLNSLDISSSHFHAGLSIKTKKDTQTKWLNNEIQVIVATIAFGLGINKPDVRFVFHHSLPKSIEGYYQETGRAGRDGLPADCILFYSPRDKRILQFLIKQQSPDAPSSNLSLIENISNFCNNKIDCRKKQLSVYLGEYTNFTCSQKSKDTYHYCDNCQKKNNCTYTDLSSYVGKIQTLLNSQKQFNKDHLIDKLSQIVLLSKVDIERLINQLIIEGYINLQTILKSHEIIEYYQPQNIDNLTKLELETIDQKNIASYFCSNNNNNELYEKLVQLRKNISEENDIPAYQIFNNRTLEEMAQRKPKTEMELLQIYGVGAQKLMAYGEQFLRVLNQ